MALETMKVRVAFSSLFCHEEADGVGSAEPYLWTLYFTIDGSSVTLDLNADNQLVLRGTSRNVGSPGSLGNLGNTDVDPQEDVVLPPAIRSHGEPLALLPIPLSAAARALHPDLDAVGGLVGYITALMENDMVSAGEAEVAHREFNRSMRNSIKDAIDEFVVPAVIQHPTAEDIKVLFQETLGPRIEALVNERRDQWATFPNYEGDDKDDKVGVHTAFFVHQSFAGGTSLQANAYFRNNHHGQFDLYGRAAGIESTNTERTLERGIEVGAPKAAGAPSGAAIGATTSIVYRDGNGHMQNLFVDANGQPSVLDLSTLTGARAARGEPFTYVEASTNNLIVLYRGDDNHVHTIYWGPGTSWFGSEDANVLAGTSAKNAAGDPVGWVAPGDIGHLVYRGDDSHLHVMWSPVGGGSVGYADLTKAAQDNGYNAPNAVGNPSAYVNPQGTNIVVYRGTDGHIWDLYWDSGAVVAENITGFTGSPVAGGDPFVYYIPAYDLNQIVYREGPAGAGRLIELFWQGAAATTGWNITDAAGPSIPPGSSSGYSQVDPVAFYNPATNTKHVIYQINGYMNELSWTLGTLAPRYKSLTIAGLAPTLLEYFARPGAFVAGQTVHIPFRGTDDHIYEIVR
jgi:hypothetical protein